jgi:hypothetical protein
MATKTKLTPQQVSQYALSIVEEHRDPIDGSINLTAVDEQCIDHFNLTDEEYEDGDYSFTNFNYLKKKGVQGVDDD